MKKTIAFIMILTMCLSLCACGTASEHDQIEGTFDQVLDIENSAIEESESKIEAADDLVSTDITTSSDKSNDKIEKTESKPDDKTLLESYEGTPLPLFMDKVSQLGYKATYFNQGVDYTEILEFYTEEDCKSFLIGNLDVDPSSKTVTVDLALASSVDLAEKEAALKEKLELGSSWIAAKEYGIDKYGSSFELNYLVGKIDESLYDENTWFLKAECKVNGQKKTCEARVTGTTANPEVIFFDIY